MDHKHAMVGTGKAVQTGKQIQKVLGRETQVHEAGRRSGTYRSRLKFRLG